MLSLDLSKISSFVSEEEISNIRPSVEMAEKVLNSRTGAGSDFLGWVDLPVDYDKEEFERIKNAAKKIKSDSDVLVVVGIGGSYLGAKAAIEMLTDSFYNLSSERKTPMIIFAGNSISSSYLADVISLLKDKDFSVNIISKSGTTTEPALAFRILRSILIEKYGEEEAKKRIYATTDKARGALKTFADKEGYETFVIPDDVGGRFSIFDDATIFTLAFAGVEKADVIAMLESSLKAQEEFLNDDINTNLALQQAAFNVQSKLNGKQKHFVEYFGDAFLGTTLWEKQLKNESLKARISTDTNVGPGYLHYNAEADLDAANKDSFFTFVYVTPQEKVTSAVVKSRTSP